MLIYKRERSKHISPKKREFSLLGNYLDMKLQNKEKASENDKINVNEEFFAENDEKTNTDEEKNE